MNYHRFRGVGVVARGLQSTLLFRNSRCFSSTRVLEVKTTDLSERELAEIKIDGCRLWAELHKTCEWGRGERWGPDPTDTGMSRLALSDADKQARDWFVETTKSLGCATTVDSMGNIYAVRPGLREGPATFAGSHLDTQPSGGRYDGILGVHAGIEALRTMNDNNIETIYPMGVLNWTNEEGARFPISMCSSSVHAGQLPLEKAHSLREVGDGTATQKSELERIGYLGQVEAHHSVLPLGAHFELHIEQGPTLEASGKKIGVVEGSQAFRWYQLTVEGQDCHTGTTNLEHRSDALLAAAKMILHSHNTASELGCLASTGILTLKPGSTNTVPGLVRFSLDLRSGDDSTLLQLEQALETDFVKIANGEDVGGVSSRGTKGRPCTVKWQNDTRSPAIRFHKECIQCIEDSAKAYFGTNTNNVEDYTQRMISGAGHDR